PTGRLLCHHHPFPTRRSSDLMWRTCSGVLKASRVSSPPKPLRLVANSTLCQAEKLSSWVQLTQLVVNGHLWPLALSLAAASATSDRKSTRLNSSHEWTSYAVF